MDNMFEYNNLNLLPLYVMRTGYKEQQYHIIRNQGYPAYQLAVCTHGSGEFICMGNRHLISCGDIFIFVPRIAHEYYPVDSEWSIHFFIFSGDGVPGIMQYIGIENYAVFSMNDEESERCNDIMTKLHEIFRSESGFRSSSLMYQILSGTEKLSRKKSINKTDTDGIHERIVTPVIRYMRETYKENISLDDMCKIAEVSRSYLCRVFKKKTGISPIKYLINIRLEEARKILVSTDMRVNRISQEVGFNDISYFCAVFRSSMGVTPDEYRRIQTD